MKNNVASKRQKLPNMSVLQLCIELYEMLIILSAQKIAIRENTGDWYKFSLCYTLDYCEVVFVIQWTGLTTLEDIF